MMIDPEIIQNLTDTLKGTPVAYIKIYKNTKGYNWEIKQLSTDIKALEKLNNEMITKFGDQI